jgi:protein SCO1
MSPGFVPLLALVLTAGIGALGWETDGFRILTTEGAWRIAVERHPIPVPSVQLRDQNRKTFSLSDYRGRTLLVEFIYTRCPTLCSFLSRDFRDVLTSEPNAPAASNIDLVSISFDPQHDRGEALRQYALHYGAVAPRWRIAVPSDRRDLATLLHTFGVVVIPDRNGGFVHNDYVYLVDARGRLKRILDPDAAPAILASALRASGT